ncbi:MAG: hypothetical protein IKO94_07085 [Selenomonadaceae bacterium]|nr:hypothetical protein [Clostridia bacterium]MBR4695826.1 hypothetical protein [Selenomonadaceae bacterium]
MKRKRPGRSFFGGKCGFFGGAVYVGGRRPTGDAILQFFNRLLFNRGSKEEDDA